MNNLHHQCKSSWRQVLGDPSKKENIKDEEHGGGVVVRTGVNHVTGGKNYSTILKLKADTMKKKIELKSYSRRCNKYLRRPSYKWLPGPNFLHRSILLYNHSQFLLKILLF